MAQPTVAGVQLPPDSTGKITGAFSITVSGQTVWVPSVVLANADGYEIGQSILDAMREQNELLSRAVTALALIAGEFAGVNPDELALEAAI